MRSRLLFLLALGVQLSLALGALLYLDSYLQTTGASGQVSRVLLLWLLPPVASAGAAVGAVACALVGARRRLNLPRTSLLVAALGGAIGAVAGVGAALCLDVAVTFPWEMGEVVHSAQYAADLFYFILVLAPLSVLAVASLFGVLLVWAAAGLRAVNR